MLVTEWIDGPNMEQIIFYDKISSQYPPISLPVKVHISHQVAQGLAYLHGRKQVIIHCDIKPANVLLSKNFDCVKICDIRISKARVNDRTFTTSVKDVLPGTPAYLAPALSQICGLLGVRLLSYSHYKSAGHNMM